MCILSYTIPKMSNCKLSEAIQNRPPELREKILKSLIVTKITERATLGWEKVNATISKMPFCEYRKCLVPIFACSAKVNATISKTPFCEYRQCLDNYEVCDLEGCCFSCYIRAGYPIHEPKNSKEFLKVEHSIEYMYFLRLCISSHHNLRNEDLSDEDF